MYQNILWTKYEKHLQHPSHQQSPQHCRWSHPPDTQLLQSATIREETEESPSQDKQTERQLHPPGCQEAELPPVLAPPPLSYPTNHWSLTPPTTTTTTTPTHTNTHTHTHTLTLRQAPVTCTALDWPHSTTSSDSLNKKDCSLSGAELWAGLDGPGPAHIDSWPAQSEIKK